MNIKEYLSRRSKTFIIAIAMAVLCLVGLMDYVTGYDFGFSLFYLLPIILVSWFVNRKAGMLFSLMSSLIIFVADYFAGKTFIPSFVELWDFSIHLGFFTIIGFLVAQLKSEFDEHMRLIVELKNSVNEIKVLSGMLPICASCKKIRDDKGYWNQIESYISKHSEVQFSHSVCPDCMEKLYPEIYKKMKEKEKNGQLYS